MIVNKGMFRQFMFGDTIVSSEPLSADEAGKLISKGKGFRDRGSIPSQDEILEVFSRLSKAWADPVYRGRQEAVEALSKSSDLSSEFIKAVLGEFANLLAPEYLLNKLEGELGNARIQNRLVAQKSDGISLIVQPAGQILHIASGNVFLACVESLIDGIITRNINYLKMSTDDREFPVIFAKSIKEFDPKGVVSGRLAVLWWRGGDEAVEKIFKQEMDRIVFWGGGEALRSWEKGLSESAVLVKHGPKVSFGVVSSGGLTSLTSEELQGLTDKIALDIAIWEQKACNCPQTIFLEESAPAGAAKRFVDSLSASLKNINSVFPPGRRSDDECVEILKTRELAVAKHLVTGDPVSVIGPKTFDWTIIFEEKGGRGEFELSPLCRTIIIKRYSSLDALSDSLKGYSSYLQTIGYCLDKPEVSEYAVKLSSLGVTRLCPFGIMAIPQPGTPHDGTFALRDLTRFTVVES